MFDASGKGRNEHGGGGGGGGGADTAATHVRRDERGWREIDERMRGLAARRAALDLEEARLLMIARRMELHRHLGYGSFAEYLERVLGYAPTTGRDRVRVAEELETLPAIAVHAPSQAAPRRRHHDLRARQRAGRHARRRPLLRRRAAPATHVSRAPHRAPYRKPSPSFWPTRSAPATRTITVESPSVSSSRWRTTSSIAPHVKAW
jgi:hypothetical protein